MSGEVHSVGLPGLGFVKNSNKYKALLKKYDDLKGENEKLTKEKEEINAKFHEMDARIHELEGENDQLKMEIDGLKKKNDQLEEENDELEEENDQLEEGKDQLINDGWTFTFLNPARPDEKDAFIIQENEKLAVGAKNKQRGLLFLASILHYVTANQTLFENNCIWVWIERDNEKIPQLIDKSLLMESLPDMWFSLGGPDTNGEIVLKNYWEENTIIGEFKGENEKQRFEKEKRTPVDTDATLILRMMDPRKEDPNLQEISPLAVKKKEMINIIEIVPKKKKIAVDTGNPYVVYF
tara:strand:- start:6330 stop:7214 length:885 start_codon:yes stop_codon:yes gene_type:complete